MLKASQSSSPLGGHQLEAHRDRSILSRQKSRIIIQSERSQGVQSMDVVDDVEVRSDHVAILVILVLCKRLSRVASALQLLQHGADNLVHAPLGDQRHGAGKEDNRVGLRQGDVEVVYDVGDVCYLLVS